jgi:hypothetical protein
MLQPKKPLVTTLATRKDSMLVKEESQRVLNEYLKRGYIPTTKKFPQETLDETLVRMQNKKGTTELIRKGVRDTENYNTSEFRVPLNENQFRQRESASGVLNMDIEPPIYDNRIAPTNNIYLMGQGAGTYNDGVSIPSYSDMVINEDLPKPKTAPLAVKPLQPKKILKVTPKEIKPLPEPTKVNYMETIKPQSDTLDKKNTGVIYTKNQGRLALKGLNKPVMACGGRLPSSKRHIAPSALVGGVGAAASLIPGYGTAISAGLGLVSGMMAKGEASSEQKKLEEEQKRLQFNQQRQEDAYALSNYNTAGETGVQYYANGGELNNASSTKGKYLATGGDLVPLNSTTEEVEGNSHGSKAIDGQYGVTLNDGQEDIAEVEGGEVIKDNEKVYSNRLMYDKKNSFADKAKQIAKKTAKIETKLNDTKDTKSRNGLERNLAGMKMADEVLFNKQEQVKQIEGLKELEGVGETKMAYGGPIPKANWLDNIYGNNVPRVAGDGTMTDEQATGNIGSFLMSPKVINQSNPMSVNAGITARKGYPSFAQTNVQAPKTPYDMSTVAPEVDPSDPSFINQLAPHLIDNLGNMFINSNTPKLPKPILNKPADIDTTVNVNPQLASIAEAKASGRADILNNTSNSNVARANIAQNNLRALQAKLGVLSEKENTEKGLRNQNAMYRQGVTSSNNNIMSNANMLEFQRRGEIQSRNSANLADLSSNIKDITTNRAKDEYYDTDLIASLLDDPTGEKARVFARNPNLLKRSATKKAMSSEQLRRANKKAYNFSDLTDYGTTTKK